MTLENYKKMRKLLSISLPKTIEFNPLPSDTDPTQDIPVKMIEVTAAGIPVNVKTTHGVFSNVKCENLTSIERRNNDKFDNVIELQRSIERVSRDGISTDYVQPTKTPKKHE